MIYKSKLIAQSFSLERSLSCGQAFRWKSCGEGFFGIAKDKPLFIVQKGDVLHLSCEEEELPFWHNYFALDCDYSEMEQILEQDSATAPCLKYSKGIRIFRQDAFEGLICFLVSQNNNVVRISGIVERLCAAFGQRGVLYDHEYFTFPTAQQLACATIEQLTALGTGYRAAYIQSAANKVAQGYDLEALRNTTFAQAYEQLLEFKGVGPKVAQCVMLFALGFERAFPVDVWVARIVKHLYPDGDTKLAARMVVKRFGNWSGAAQQYLFHYARTVGLGKKKKADSADCLKNNPDLREINDSGNC